MHIKMKPAYICEYCLSEEDDKEMCIVHEYSCSKRCGQNCGRSIVFHTEGHEFNPYTPAALKYVDKVSKHKLIDRGDCRKITVEE